jgi:predicted DCC family thiol-disulfide oxidoreductase YuxK
MKNTTNYPLTLLYDGACQLCKLEMDNLKARDALNRLVLVDIAQPGFDPAPFGATLDAMQALIHARRPDGSLVVGVEVFRLAYGAVGLGWLTAPTALPGLQPLLERAYAVFARNRYAVSGALAPLITHIAARRALRRTQACRSGNCPIPPERSSP